MKFSRKLGSFAPLFVMMCMVLPAFAADSGADVIKTEQSNRELIQGFFDDFSAGRTDEAFKKVAEDVSWWVPGNLPFSGTKTKAQYLQVVGRIRAGFPEGLAFTVKSMIAEGDRVAAEVESLGKHVSGKTYNNHYHFLFTLRSGEIVGVKEYMDTLHLLQLISP